jgi:hypothetical protein
MKTLTLGQAPAGLEVPLNRILTRPVRFANAAAALAAAARRAWPGEWQNLTASGPILERAHTHLPRFSSDEWTWRR